MKTLLSKTRLKTPKLGPSRHRGKTARTTPQNTVAAPSHSERAIFDWYFPNARQVCIAGTFNDWAPTATPLVNCGDGRWLLDLTLKPGRYEFRFFVDGKWAEDTGVTRRFLFVN